MICNFQLNKKVDDNQRNLDLCKLQMKTNLYLLSEHVFNVGFLLKYKSSGSLLYSYFCIVSIILFTFLKENPPFPH